MSDITLTTEEVAACLYNPSFIIPIACKVKVIRYGTDLISIQCLPQSQDRKNTTTRDKMDPKNNQE